MQDFSAFLDVRRYKIGLIKTASENTYLKIAFPGFPPSIEDLSSVLHPELLSGGVEKSAAAAAQDLILVEVDGQCPRQGSI